VTLANDNGTDGQTNGQTDGQSATQYAAPSQGGGPHKKDHLSQAKKTVNTPLNSLSLCFSGHFPGEPGLAGVY